MLLNEVRDILDAEILCGEDKLDTVVLSACGSDFMSDVLAFVKNQSLLLTGLINPQVVRTADMMNMNCIVFVRGKHPDAATLALAKERGMVVMVTSLSMYYACGKLYFGGLQGNIQ